jgi:bifunctional non-homologous end joining protein LigD
MSTIIQSINLHSTHAGSDKVYHVQLCEVDGGFVINYQNGRRGGTLASGTKTKTPVAKDKAQAIYDRLVREKVNGDSHYTIVGSDDTSATTVVTEKTMSGFLPMLPTAVEESQIETLLSDDGWVLSRKFDGERVLVIIQADGQILGSNRLGFVRALPQVLVDAFRASAFPTDTVFDGELVDNTYYMFDLLRLRGEDCKPWGFRKREQSLERLQLMSGDSFTKLLRAVVTYTDIEKREQFAQLRKDGAEGVIFRDVYGAYSVGRAENCVKFKFTESATLLVDGHEPSKRSVYLSGFDSSGNRITMGKVTIPPNFAIPEVDAIVEVQYLYAYPVTHAMAQPVYKGTRSDQTQESCVLSQLKYKAANVGDAEAGAA